MSFFENIKAKATEVTQRYFESEEELPKESEDVEESLTDLQLQECIVDENVQQTAQEILQEAVAELNQTEDTIYAVKDCLETMGEESSSAIITKMIVKVAKKDPKVLKLDGEERIKRIEKVVADTKSSTQKALEEATSREKQIMEAENASESSYTADVSELNKKCEEDIMALRTKLQADIEQRGQQREEELNTLKEEREKIKTEKEKVGALNRAVMEVATEQQEEINLYLSKLQVEE